MLRPSVAKPWVFPCVASVDRHEHQKVMFPIPVVKIPDGSETNPFDVKAGISTEQMGRQRQTDMKRPEAMARRLERLLREGRMASFGAFVFYAMPKDVDVKNGKVSINRILDLIDGGHRRAEIALIMGSDAFPLSKEFLTQQSAQAILYIPSAERVADGSFVRDREELFHFFNSDMRMVAKSHVMSQEAITAIRDIEAGAVVTPEAMRLAIISRAWNRLISRRAWVWSDRVDLIGTQKGGQDKKRLTFSEMVRTTNIIPDILRSSGDIPSFDGTSEEQHIAFESGIDATVVAMAGFWRAISQRLPEMCEAEGIRRWGLLHPASVKALNAIMAAFLRYSRESPRPKFRRTYGTLDLKGVMEQPLLDLLDNKSSLLRGMKSDFVTDFWERGGGYADYHSNYKGIGEMANFIWKSVRPEGYSQKTWTKFMETRRPRSSTSRATPIKEDEDENGVEAEPVE